MDLARLLKDNGVRATAQRVAVAKILADAAEPLDARQIYEHLQRQKRDIGIASVYRSLTLFEKFGIASRLPQINQTAVRYRLAGASQGQVVCAYCGKTEDIGQMPELEHLRETVADHSEFATKNQDLYIITGCRKKPQCG